MTLSRPVTWPPLSLHAPSHEHRRATCGCQPRPDADRLLNRLTEEPAWPTLRGHLLLLAAAGADPVAELFASIAPGI